MLLLFNQDDSTVILILMCLTIASFGCTAAMAAICLYLLNRSTPASYLEEWTPERRERMATWKAEEGQSGE